MAMQRRSVRHWRMAPRRSSQSPSTSQCFVMKSTSGLNALLDRSDPQGDSQMSGNPRALVIGGSVGGLFAAHMLRSIGWDVVVFERSGDDLARRGAGIGASDAMFAVMRRIGVP